MKLSLNKILGVSVVLAFLACTHIASYKLGRFKQFGNDQEYVDRVMAASQQVAADVHNIIQVASTRPTTKASTQPFERNTAGSLSEPLLDTYAMQKELGDAEYTTILNASLRNMLSPRLFPLLCAIRKAENGGPGREFGVLNDKAKDLDSQAGWCAATVAKQYSQWQQEGRPENFIDYLGKRYAPVGASNDPRNLNSNWGTNVRKWYVAFGGSPATVEKN